MTSRLPRLVLCISLLAAGAGGHGVRESAGRTGAGKWTAEGEPSGEVAIMLAPVEALPFLHRGKCDDVPGVSVGLRWGTMPVRSALSRRGLRGAGSSGAAGFSVEIQHPRLLI